MLQVGAQHMPKHPSRLMELEVPLEFWALPHCSAHPDLLWWSDCISGQGKSYGCRPSGLP